MNESPQELGYDRRRLLIASCIAILATAMTFSIRADTLKAFGLEFGLNHQQEGYINLLGIWGFPLAIILVGPLCDTIGMGKLLKLAASGHILGTVLTIASAPLKSFPLLLLANLIFGLSNGTVEAVANPLVATMYRDDKTAKLNLLHAFWPAGLMVGGLLAYTVSQIMGVAASPVAGPATALSWKIKWAFVIVAAVAYLLLSLNQKFPATERVESGVTNKEMFRSAMVPGFMFFAFIMCLTAITELGPDQWVGSVLTDTVGIQGILFLVYTSGLMFVLRLSASRFIHALTPLGMLLIASVLSCIGLYALSYSFTAGAAFLAVTVFGLGKAFYWPTMLGVASERYPRTGALGLAVMGGLGMMAAGLAGPLMGGIYDRGTVAELSPTAQQAIMVDGKVAPELVNEWRAKAEAGDSEAKTVVSHYKYASSRGAALTFRYVSILPAFLTLIFALLFVYWRDRPGQSLVEGEPATVV